MVSSSRMAGVAAAVTAPAAAFLTPVQPQVPHSSLAQASSAQRTETAGAQTGLTSGLAATAGALAAVAGASKMLRRRTATKASTETPMLVVNWQVDPKEPKPGSGKMLEGMVGADVEMGDKPWDPMGFGRLYDINFDMNMTMTYPHVQWLREAEVKHGRICMLAFVGCLVQQFAHIPGLPVEPDWTKALDACYDDPAAALGIVQISVFAMIVEGKFYPGDAWIGQLDREPGDLGFDPFKLAKKPGFDLQKLQLQEIKNGRLAMIGMASLAANHAIPGSVPLLTGLYAQENDAQSFCGGSIAQPKQSVEGNTTAHYTTKKVLPSFQWLKSGVKTGMIAPGEVIAKTLGGNDVLIGKSQSGSLFCVGNLCPHLGTPMSEGAEVKGDSIICPLHGSTFSTKTGDLLEWCPSPPIVGPLTGFITEQRNLAVFNVRTGFLSDDIEVNVDTNAKKAYEADYWKGLLDAQGKVVSTCVRDFNRWAIPLATLIAAMNTTLGATLAINKVRWSPPGEAFACPGEAGMLRFIAINLPALSALVAGPAGIWLVVKASTEHLRSTALFATINWAYHTGRWVVELVDCDAEALGAEDCLLCWYGFMLLMTSLLFLALMYTQNSIVIDRFAVLEEHSQHDLHSRLLSRMLKILICLGIPPAIWVALQNYLRAGQRVIGIYVWLLALLGTAVFVWGVRGLLAAVRIAAAATQATAINKRTSKRAVRTLRRQAVGIIVGLSTSILSALVIAQTFGVLWPLRARGGILSNWQGSEPMHQEQLVYQILMLLDGVGNTFFALAVSGSLSGALTGTAARAAADKEKLRRWEETSAEWHRLHVEGGDWDSKVQELAGRGVTVSAILRFYRGLGNEYMQHFDPKRSTTSDVVRHAVIPLSQGRCCSYAEVMMDGECSRPRRMVTHHWSNRFKDTIASIIADALEEADFAWISSMLEHDADLLETWIEAKGTGSQAYWLCIFAVNQHLSICSENRGKGDTVTGELYPECQCSSAKAWNTTAPTLPDGRSICCEMNKFDDMMEYLSAKDPEFRQVVAVDIDFAMFGRAWCIAEIATAYQRGMGQFLKVWSEETLSEHTSRLRSLRIQDMAASRPEDVQHILDGIPDVEAFNLTLRRLLLEDLLPSWSSLDGEERMAYAGRLIRWHHANSGKFSPLNQSPSRSPTDPATPMSQTGG